MNTLKVIFGFVVLLMIILYIFQENLIFFPEKLPANYTFHFDQNFKELNFNTSDDKSINSLLFQIPDPKGLIFYLHGNTGSLRMIGDAAKTYTDLGYDVFMFDYPGFGKSTGTISSQKQLMDNNQLLYNEMKKIYKEEDIVLVGYSIGTGMAAKLAADNHPKQLILQAPYYNFTDLVKHKNSLTPTFLLKYTFDTQEYLNQTKVPVILFHGKKDEVIYYQSSEKLKRQLGNQALLFLFDQQGHSNLDESMEFHNKIKEVLSE